MNPEFWIWYGTLTSLAFGLCIGSFLNVCIYRIPNDLSIVRPRSFCPGCRAPITWYQNIPVLSYLVLRGRCQTCRMPISARYPLVELLTGALFVAVWNRFGLDPLTLIFWIMISGLIVATFVDFDHMIIPDSISIGGMVFGIIASVLVPTLHSTDVVKLALIQSGIGLIAGVGSLWLVAIIGRWVFKKDAMGLGDVKLLGAVGALLGLPGVVYTILISSIVGTIIGLTMIALGGHQWRSRLPYGPYLAVAAVSWVLGGDQLWNIYIKFVTGQ
jgi:leader peptidase (prepilin peptidase) / N-methyltransferase